MKKVIGKVALILSVLLIIGGVCFYRYYFRVLYNDSYVNGNSAGNLYNNGMFCESNGSVFFANPSDEYKLYVMDADGSNVKKICEDSVAYINADEHYVYYTRASSGANTAFSFLHINTYSLCRIRRDGRGEIKILDDAPCIYASLVGNYIYYLHYDTEEATTMYKVKLDGEDQKQISTSPYFTCSTNRQYIYYNGLTNDHNVYRFDTTNDTQSLLYQGNCWMPTVVNDSVLYFIDCENNYKLARVDLATGEKVILCEDRVDCYNVSGNYIYFQRNSDDAALCRINTDGSNYTEIKSGVFNEINVTSKYVYFSDFFSDVVYRCPVSSDGPAEFFTP